MMSDAVGSGSVHVTVPVVPQFFEVSASLSLSLAHSLTRSLPVYFCVAGFWHEVFSRCY
jgi:hypothetical protein